MKIANFDLSIAPIVVIRVVDIEPTEELFDDFLKEMNETLDNTSGKIVMITDLTHAKFLSADLRIKMGNWYKDNDAILKQKVAGMVLVNKSVILNVVIKGIFFIKKPSVHTEIFSTLEEAIAWSEEKLMVTS